MKDTEKKVSVNYTKLIREAEREIYRKWNMNIVQKIISNSITVLDYVFHPDLN